MLTNCLAACAHLTITVSEIERDIGENNGRKAGFSIPPCIRRPRYGGFRRNIGTPFGAEKLEWCCYPMVKKIRRYVYSFWRDPRTWRKDGQTLHDSKDRTYASHRAVKAAAGFLLHFAKEQVLLFNEDFNVDSVYHKLLMQLCVIRCLLRGVGLKIFRLTKLYDSALPSSNSWRSKSLPLPHHFVHTALLLRHCCQPVRLVAWHSGRTSVFDPRTFAVLSSTCGWPLMWVKRPL